MADEKRATPDQHSAAQRRARFYAEEAEQMERSRGRFRNEEPNLRVYFRSVLAVLQTAHDGLSAEDFGQLKRGLAAELERM